MKEKKASERAEFVYMNDYGLNISAMVEPQS